MKVNSQYFVTIFYLTTFNLRYHISAFLTAKLLGFVVASSITSNLVTFSIQFCLAAVSYNKCVHVCLCCAQTGMSLCPGQLP